MPRSLEKVVKIFVSLAGHLMVEDNGPEEANDVALGMEPGEVDKVGVELIVTLPGSTKDRLVVVLEAAHALVTKGGGLKLLGVGIFSGCWYTQKSRKERTNYWFFELRPGFQSPNL